jgi:uncharacterized protein YbjT (DUF2867 family)
MILVVGATGVLGSEICRRLRDRNRDVRGLVRTGSPKEAALRKLGVEISSGDLRSRAAIEAACRGVSAVITTATAMGSKDKSLTLRAIDRDAQLQLVEVARNSGVEKFVYVSLSPQLRRAPLVRHKRAVEAAVRASGMQWTILQPCAFMEIWLGKELGWDIAAGSATMVGAGRAGMAWISVVDVADYAVRSLDDPRLANRDLPLGGPELLSPSEVVKIFEAVSRRQFKIKRIPRPMLALLAPVIAPFNEAIGSGMSMFAQAALGDDIDTSLQREVGVQLTTVREYATRVVNDAGTARV